MMLSLTRVSTLAEVSTIPICESDSPNSARYNPENRPNEAPNANCVANNTPGRRAVAAFDIVNVKPFVGRMSAEVNVAFALQLDHDQTFVLGKALRSVPVANCSNCY
jgi:hypothetical protein